MLKKLFRIYYKRKLRNISAFSKISQSKEISKKLGILVKEKSDNKKISELQKYQLWKV